MASNVTQHYQLCQWEPGDKVERLDFNSDNEKIDAAVKAAVDLAQSAGKKAAAAYSQENSPFVVGTYVGNCSGTSGTQTVELGFRPKAVLVQAVHVDSSSWHTGAYIGFTASEQIYQVSGHILLQLTDTGFVIGSYSSGSYTYAPVLNLNGKTYCYIAFR